MNSDEIPLMFQAQIEGRCQLQRKESERRHQAYDWKDEWTKPYPKPQPKAVASPKPQTVSQLAFARSPKTPVGANSECNPLATPPKFGRGVQTKEYCISWRLVSNSGQDANIIRPIIGAKGYPYYPGSSMKGAFRQACESEAQALRYCGGEVPVEDGENKLQPGILRFHGAYPVDTSWTNCLVDPVHSQQSKQVIADETTNANVQISLYRVKLRFGISSAILEPTDPRWEEIWKIWEKALSSGLGSRVSAGYGYFDVSSQVSTPEELQRVELKGRGLASTLLQKERPEEKTNTPEFRPNMFKACLRGHTLRLLGGMTDPQTAQYLTKILWGGFGDDRSNGKNAIQGLLRVRFEGDLEKAIGLHEYIPKSKPGENRSPTPQYAPVYNLDRGVLRILLADPNITEEHRQKLTELTAALIRFTMLLGGFGKSWRRIDHRLFAPNYTKHKPPIGCHWEFAPASESLYLPIHTLQDVTRFIDSVRDCIQSWADYRGVQLGNAIAERWREAWHPDNNSGCGVQVWGRISKSKISKALPWFHRPYRDKDSIYKSCLTGGMNQTGRIWHRMYPHYDVDSQGTARLTGGYVEFLTIFPGKRQSDGSDTTSLFLTFLDQETEFQRLW